jgi:hypothetical protein
MSPQWLVADEPLDLLDPGAPACAHCGGPQRGYAAINDAPLRHPDVDLDCYRLVTVHGHSMPCGPCAHPAGEQ